MPLSLRQHSAKPKRGAGLRARRRQLQLARMRARSLFSSSLSISLVWLCAAAHRLKKDSPGSAATRNDLAGLKQQGLRWNSGRVDYLKSDFEQCSAVRRGRPLPVGTPRTHRQRTSGARRDTWYAHASWQHPTCTRGKILRPWLLPRLQFALLVAPVTLGSQPQ
jgi:hypothetical protein